MQVDILALGAEVDEMNDELRDAGKLYANRGLSLVDLQLLINIERRPKQLFSYYGDMVGITSNQAAKCINGLLLGELLEHTAPDERPGVHKSRQPHKPRVTLSDRGREFVIHITHCTIDNSEA